MRDKRKSKPKQPKQHSLAELLAREDVYEAPWQPDPEFERRQERQQQENQRQIEKQDRQLREAKKACYRERFPYEDDAFDYIRKRDETDRRRNLARAGSLETARRQQAAPALDRALYVPIVLVIHKRTDLSEAQKRIADEAWRISLRYGGRVRIQDLASWTTYKSAVVEGWMTRGPLKNLFRAIPGKSGWYDFRAYPGISWSKTADERNLANRRQFHGSVPRIIAGQLSAAEASLLGRIRYGCGPKRRRKGSDDDDIDPAYGRTWFDASDSQLAEELGWARTTLWRNRRRLEELELIRCQMHPEEVRVALKPFRGQQPHRYLVLGVAGHPRFPQKKKSPETGRSDENDD
jgi:hypothetical protein